MAQLKDDLKANETLARFKTVGELSTAFLELDGKLKAAVPLLPDNATEEEKAAFYTRLGRPETPDGYAVDKAAIPNWGPADDALETAMRPELHKLGLTQSQYGGLVTAFAGFNAKIAEANVQATQAAMAAMTAEFGDKAAGNFEAVARIVEKLGGPELKGLLETVEVDGVKLGNYPALVKAFLPLASVVLEDTYVAGGKSAPVADGFLDYGKT
jgi:hypothetical protein